MHVAPIIAPAAFTHTPTKFDTTARIRFLDCLASHGNVRSAAARVGVSRETAYRTRRRDRGFAAMWDAALIHARSAAEAELATRALDGVPVQIYARGEHVATWHRQDTRLLLAHLGRLDARIADDHAANMNAEHFDQRLAAMAGHRALEDFSEAVRTIHAQGASAGIPCADIDNDDEGNAVVTDDAIPSRADYA
ncbi:MAG: hypothetical protein WA948_00160 [Pontixanthobacter sp.]